MKCPGPPRTAVALLALKQKLTGRPGSTSLELIDRSLKCGRGAVTVTVADCEIVLAPPSSAVRVKVVVSAGATVKQRLSAGRSCSTGGVIRTALAFSTP